MALYDLAKKASVRDNAVLPVLLCSTVCGCAAFLLGITVTGRFVVLTQASWQTVLLGGSKSVIVATSWIFTFCALRTLPITIATPIRASAPALVFLIALFLYGEVPSCVQGAGMLLVFAGYWTFSWAGRAEGIDFFRNRAVWCAIVGAIFSALSAIFDKFVFQVIKAPVDGVQFYFQIGLVIVYAVALLATRLGSRAKPLRRFQWRATIPMVGILLAAADWLYFTGLAHPDVPISVASLMRRFSVVITFVLGAVWFRERNLRRKGVALFLVLAGLALLLI